HLGDICTVPTFGDIYTVLTFGGLYTVFGVVTFGVYLYRPDIWGISDILTFGDICTILT
ncbi:unnamed protein product, partial [Staurois parvus]